MTDWTSDAGGVVQGGGGRLRFVAGAVIIIAALVLLVISATQGNAQYLLTVEELRSRGDEMIDEDVRVSGIVVPDSISYDANSLHLEFDIVDREHPSQDSLRIVIDGEPLPDQMKDEAEAIAEGRLGADGNFHAETLMMKCASKYDVEVEE